MLNIDMIRLFIITLLLIFLSLTIISCKVNPTNGSPFYPLKSDFRQEYLIEVLKDDVGKSWNKAFINPKITGVKNLSNNNIAYFRTIRLEYGGWITNCQYYYEVNKNTNIIVGYKITDPDPDKNCRMLPGY